MARHLCEKAKRRDLHCRHRQQRQDHDSGLDCDILSGVAPVRSQLGTNVYRAHVRSLLRNPYDSYFVSETGSSGPGTLEPVLNVVRPTVGVVTLVALEHKSTFRSIEAVAEEKGKLVEMLPANGLAVLNYDDPRVAAMARRSKARTVTFGRTGETRRLRRIEFPLRDARRAAHDDLARR